MNTPHPNRRPRRVSALEGTLIVFATIVCLPAICIVGGGVVTKDLIVKACAYESPKRQAKRMEKQRVAELVRNTPKALGPRLERNLTIGRAENDVFPAKSEAKAVGDSHVNPMQSVQEVEMARLRRVMSVTSQQEDAAFFRLPFEIRRVIYENLLGGYVFHIRYQEAYRRMSHTRCKTLSPELCNGVPCRRIVKIGGAADGWGNVSLLSFVQSCRRIYSEALPLLYTLNTFEFCTLNDVMKLSLTVLPERMHLIKKVDWEPCIAQDEADAVVRESEHEIFAPLLHGYNAAQLRLPSEDVAALRVGRKASGMVTTWIAYE